MSETKIRAVVASFLLAGLSACGGGGSAAAPSGPVTSTLSFPLQSAENTFVANGVTKTFTVAGTCSGTGSMSVAPAATGATFEGAAALSMVQTITISFTNCTPASIASTATSYFNSSYVQLGLNGSVYGVFLTPPTIPTSVTVGGTGIVGTLTLYTDSTKATGSGRQDLSYVIEPDTSTTAIVNKIIKTYNAAGTLIQTAQARARIAMVGATTPISLDTQAANGSTTHLVLTFN